MTTSECICSGIGKTNILNQQNIAKKTCRKYKYNPQRTSQTQHEYNYFKMC